MPQDLLRLRIKCHSLYNAALVPIPTQANFRKAKFRLHAEGILLASFRPLMETLSRSLQTACMLSECLLFSLEGAGASNPPPPPTAEEKDGLVSSNVVSSMVDDILRTLSSDESTSSDGGNETNGLERFASPVWLQLPFIAALLPKADPHIAQRALLSLCVILKTDDEGVEAEVLCSCLDAASTTWVNLLIDMAYYGLTTATEPFEPLPALSFSSSAEDDAAAAVCGTFCEISLEALVIVVEHKLRYHDEDAWQVWESIMVRLQTMKTATQDHMLRRATLLLFQRLVKKKPNVLWAYTLVANVGKVLLLLEGRSSILGNSIAVSDEILHPSTGDDYTVATVEEETNGIPSSSAPRISDAEQLQLLTLLVDLMNRLRSTSFAGYELNALQPALRILLGTEFLKLSLLCCLL